MPSHAPPLSAVPGQVAYTRDAPSYDARTSAFDTYRSRLVELLPLQRGDVVLDVGCGTGLLFEQVRDRIGAEGVVVGVDLSRDMLAMAAARVAEHGWTNVVLVQAPVEQAVLPVVADHALFCATHDVLQCDAALDNVLAHVRDGGTVAATGGKWAPPWAIALNAGILALHAPYVRDFAGFDRPWGRLQPRLRRLRVQEVAMGAGYLASGTVPARVVPLESVPLESGPLEFGVVRSAPAAVDECRPDGTHG